MAVEGDDGFSRRVFARIAADEQAHVTWIEEHGMDPLRNRRRK